MSNYTLPASLDQNGDLYAITADLGDASGFTDFDEDTGFFEFKPDNNAAGKYTIEITVAETSTTELLFNTYELLVNVSLPEVQTVEEFVIVVNVSDSLNGTDSENATETEEVGEEEVVEESGIVVSAENSDTFIEDIVKSNTPDADLSEAVEINI